MGTYGVGIYLFKKILPLVEMYSITDGFQPPMLLTTYFQDSTLKIKNSSSPSEEKYPK